MVSLFPIHHEWVHRYEQDLFVFIQVIELSAHVVWVWIQSSHSLDLKPRMDSLAMAMPTRFVLNRFISMEHPQNGLG